ncbi:unnamed protein product [Symbiodinium natans]|uniref:Uncharacterized protein n=1 Tax=Symbiodinium natans TaxID=878477 RepID=A0A812L104_9DINO|nr:unnamed protein product [Symbiodinium natans]
MSTSDSTAHVHGLCVQDNEHHLVGMSEKLPSQLAESCEGPFFLCAIFGTGWGAATTLLAGAAGSTMVDKKFFWKALKTPCLTYNSVATLDGLARSQVRAKREY